MREFHLRQLVLLFAVVGLALLDSACGGGGTTTVSQGTTPAAGGSASQRVTAVDGGTVSLSGRVALKIPAGALPADTTVTVTTSAEEGPAPGELDGAKPVGDEFKVDLGGQKPSSPVTLEIAFAPELLPEGTPDDAVFLAYYDEGKQAWVPVGGRVDKDRHVIIVETDHLSWWNPFTWNWDAWIAVLKKTLSLRLTDFVEGISLLTGECKESGQNVTVDNSKGNTVIKGCITKDDAASPELRVVNLKSFYVGLSPAPGGPGYPKATILGPGDAATFTASSSDTPPATVYADFTDAAMWRFVVGLVAEMLPGGDQMPNDGLAYIANGLARVFSAQEASEDLDAGDATGAAEHIYQLITGDKFIETFVKLATEYGQEHGTDMMTKWTKAGIEETFLAVASVDVIVSATDFLANYLFNNHSAVAFSWTVPSGGATPSATRTTPTAVGSALSFRASDYLEKPPTVYGAREGWRRIGVFLDVQYNGGLYEAPSVPCDMSVSIATPSGPSYGLERAQEGCLTMVQGMKVRLYFEGEVPVVLPSIAGSTVKVGLRIQPRTSSDPSYYETEVLLEEGQLFSFGPVVQDAHAFGARIPVEGGSLTVTSVSQYTEGAGDLPSVIFELTNETGYDMDLALEGGALLDARGYPYRLNRFYIAGCSVPPGFTKECSVLTSYTYGPANDRPDLSDVVIVLLPNGDVFRGSGR